MTCQSQPGKGLWLALPCPPPYLFSGAEGRQLLDLHGLVIVALLTKENLAADPLLRLRGVVKVSRPGHDVV